MTKNLRLLVATNLALFAVLSIVWTLLLPDQLVEPHDTLIAVAVADAGAAAQIAVVALSRSQLACMVAFAGVAVWLYPGTLSARNRVPREVGGAVPCRDHHQDGSTAWSPQPASWTSRFTVEATTTAPSR